MREIDINAPLRDYVEMLNYEVIRYEDLLCTVNKEDNPMPDEEWEDSWEYFSNLLEDAKIKFEYVKSMVRQVFLTEEEKKNGYSYLIDYDRLKIFVWGSDENFKWERDESKEEQFGDSLARFYGNECASADINDMSYLAKETTFQVTEDCNMACTYCYQHNKKHNSMAFDVAKKYIDMLLDNDEKINTYYDSSKMIGTVFEFIGGEPWLEIDLITQISDYIITELFRRKHKWAIRFMFCICSNGLLQMQPKVQKYLKKHFKHLSYNVTVDGSKELHDACRLDCNGCGTYDRSFAAVMQWRNDLGGRLASKMTISPFNVPYLYDSLVDMLGNGYKHINLNCVMEEGWEPHHATELYWQLHKIVDYLKDNNLLDKVELSIFDEEKGTSCAYLTRGDENPCGGAGNMLSIDWKGNIYPCLRYMENSIPPEIRERYIIGTVEDGVNIKPEHQEKVEHLRRINRRYATTDECYYCPISSRCPQCNGYNYEYNGDPGKRTTFVCDITKAESLANVYYWKSKGKNIEVNCPREWAVEIVGEDEYEKLLEMEVCSK